MPEFLECQALLEKKREKGTRISKKITKKQKLTASSAGAKRARTPAKKPIKKAIITRRGKSQSTLKSRQTRTQRNGR